MGDRLFGLLVQPQFPGVLSDVLLSTVQQRLHEPAVATPQAAIFDFSRRRLDAVDGY